MRLLFANNVVTALSIDAQPAENAITVDNGAVFPIPAQGSEAFYVTLQSQVGGPVEICLCTSRNGNVLVVQRGADSTSARGWLAGDTISMRTTAANLRDFYDANYPITGGNLQGRMFLPHEPTIDNEAATKLYVDTKTVNVFASNAEIDGVSPPANKAVSAAGLRSITAGRLASLATATKVGLIPAINELRSSIASVVTGSVFWGVFNADVSTITWNPTSGMAGNNLPPPAPNNLGHYLICEVGGSNPPVGAIPGTYYAGDWIVSDGSSTWYHLQTGTAQSISASGVALNPTVAGQDDVQSALEVIHGDLSEYLPLTGGTMLGPIQFTNAAVKTTMLDGGDALLSVLDKFTIDAGAF